MYKYMYVTKHGLFMKSEILEMLLGEVRFAISLFLYALFFLMM